MEYGVFESTNMLSTKGAARIFDVVADIDIENGTFGYLGSLEGGESDAYKFVPGYADGETVVVADQPAWDYDTSKTNNQRKDKFIISAGTRFRVREVKKNDKFAVNAVCLTPATRGDAAVDKFLTIDGTTGKLVVNGTATAGAVMNAVIEKKRIRGNTLVTPASVYGYSREMYVCRVKTLV